jgi:hypothetical protein
VTSLQCYSQDPYLPTCQSNIGFQIRKVTEVLTLNKENQPLVTNEPVEFEKQLLKFQDFKKINHNVREIRGIHLKLIKKTRKIGTCNRLDLETLGFCPD